VLVACLYRRMVYSGCMCMFTKTRIHSCHPGSQSHGDSTTSSNVYGLSLFPLPTLSSQLTLRLLLLLILNQLHIILGHLKLLHQKLQNILTQISLHRNLLATPRDLGHTRPCSKFLAEILRHLFDVEAKSFEALYGGHVLALVALDALDQDFGRREFFSAPGFGGGGFCGFLLRVFFGAFLGVDGEGGEVLFYGFCVDVNRAASIGSCLRAQQQ
jgi:hypothetical protein